MNKSEFVAAVAAKAGISQADAGRAVDAVLATVTETLARGEDIRLTGFGNFEVVQQGARTGRNPRTGEEIAIPASKAPKFRAGAGLKAAVDGSGQGGDPIILARENGDVPAALPIPPARVS